MAGILRVDEIQNGAGQSAFQIDGTGIVTPTAGIQLPYYTNATKPSSPNLGLLIFNTDLKTVEMWNGTSWTIVFSAGIGKSPSVPAESGSQILAADPTATNGLYWIKPQGYTGTPEQVYVDFGGGISGITDAGPWVRVRYETDYYSRSDAWRGQTGLTNPGAESTTAYSGDFAWEQAYGWIDSALDNADEVRQRFESWGYGSVGWTYQGNNPYMEGKGFDGLPYTRWGGNGGSHTGVPPNARLPGMSHSVTSFNGPYNNPTAGGTDPTDTNDSVWRVGIFYFRSTTPEAKHLPIRGVWNADVDGGSEQRYFPFRNGEAEQGINSDIWIKL
jgi:hypothetical protein